MRYLLGIDNGGTFVKAGIFDENGNQIAVSSEALTTITPQAGYTERDMEELWRANVKVIKKVIEKSNIDREQIVGISLSGHGKGLYMVDEDGVPVYNGILSTDGRAWKIVEDWKEKGIHKKVFEKTFQDILACQPVSLLAWFLKEKPEIVEKSNYIFSVKDYIRFQLTGEAYGEYSDFSGANLISLITNQYDIELLQLFGLEEIYGKLPPLKKSADICGYITETVANLTGLPKGIPVAAGMFDVNACGIATGLCSEEELCMIAGTWSINEFIAKAPITNGTVALNSMYCIPSFYLVEESSPTSAGNMEWFIQRLMNYEKEELEQKGSTIYERTNEIVASLDREDNSVIYLPFLNGSGENSLARGTFIGLTSFHEKKHMLRAVYEGIVFSHMSHVKKLLQNRTEPKSIRLAGGVVCSDVWVQMFADALQIPIDVVEEKELGAQGAAIVAGIAAGVYQDYQDGIAKTVKITKTVAPRKERADYYDKQYERYKKVEQALNSIWKEL